MRTTLTDYCRKQKVDPKTVRARLRRMGYHSPYRLTERVKKAVSEKK